MSAVTLDDDVSRSPYSLQLQAFKEQPDHDLKEVGDQWCTPLWLYHAIAHLCGDNGKFDFDLFTDGDNAKAERFYTMDDNALAQDWAKDFKGGCGYANPPYSRASKDHLGRPLTGMKAIMDKAASERDKGARTTWLVKAATSETWWPQEAKDDIAASLKDGGADAVIFIRGRIQFEPPKYFKPRSKKDKATGAGFSGAIVIFDKTTFFPPMSYVSLKHLKQLGLKLMQEKG